MIIKNKNATFKFEYDDHMATLTLLESKNKYYSVTINEFDCLLLRVGNQIKLKFASFTEEEVLEDLAKSGFLKDPSHSPDQI